MALDAVLAAAIVRPVTIGFLDIKDDPVHGWDGPGVFAPTGTGDPDLDGETFGSAAGAVEITDFVEDMGIGDKVTVTFAAGEMDDEEIFQQLVADRRTFQGRKARFWRGFLTADESGVLADMDALFTGVMVSAETQRQTGKPSTISVTCDQDTQKARGVGPARWSDHLFFYPDDTGSSHLNNLSRAPIAAAERGGGAGPPSDTGTRTPRRGRRS
jgi:hypothetical protein